MLEVEVDVKGESRDHAMLMWKFWVKSCVVAGVGIRVGVEEFIGFRDGDGLVMLFLLLG